VTGGQAFHRVAAAANGIAAESGKASPLALDQADQSDEWYAFSDNSPIAAAFED
jgi:hypothetical protein